MKKLSWIFAFPLPLFFGAFILGTGMALYPRGGVHTWALFCFASSCIPLIYLAARAEHTRLAGGLMVAFLLLLGLWRMGMAENSWQEQSLHIRGAEGVYELIIRDTPVRSPGRLPSLRYEADVKQVTYADGERRPVQGAVFLYLPEEIEKIYDPGDRLAIKGKISPMAVRHNPGKIDLDSRYKSRGLMGRFYVEHGKDVTYIEQTEEYRMARMASHIRRELKERFTRVLPAERASILLTLLFGGDYASIPASVIDAFSATGIIHILSVSGSHISLVFGFTCLLGRWTGLTEKMQCLLSMAFVCVYAMISGFVPPVIRASLMGLLSMGGLFFNRDRESLNLLGGAVMGMLFWEPLLLYDVSFQLSAGASAGILIFYSRMRRAITPVPWIPGWIKDSMALSTAAQVLTVPVVLYTFHSLPLYFIPANLLAAPFLDWAILAGLAGSMLCMIVPPMASLLWMMAGWFIMLSVHLILWIASWPMARVSLRGMTLPEVLLYAAAAAMLAARQALAGKPMLRKGGFAVCCFLGLWTAGTIIYAPRMEVFVPELGGETAAIIRSGDFNLVYYREGERSSFTGGRELESLLEYKGISPIHLLILDSSALQEPSRFTLSVPVKKMIRTGTAEHLNWPEEIDITTCRRGKEAAWNIGQEKTLMTNGESWIFSDGQLGVYLDGGRVLVPSERKFPPHLAWVGGSRRFKSSLSDDKIKLLRPEAAAYTGGRHPAAGEDVDLLHYMDCPAGHTAAGGMVELTGRDRWKLTSGYDRWEGML
jgi:competence protein ComEC